MLLHLLCKTIFWSVSTLLQDEALFCLKAVGRGRKVLLGIPLIEVWLGGGGCCFFGVTLDCLMELICGKECSVVRNRLEEGGDWRLW